MYALPINSGSFVHFSLNDHYNCNTYGKSEQGIKFASSTAVFRSDKFTHFSLMGVQEACMLLWSDSNQKCTLPWYPIPNFMEIAQHLFSCFTRVCVCVCACVCVCGPNQIQIIQ